MRQRGRQRKRERGVDGELERRIEELESGERMRRRVVKEIN